VFFEKDGGLPVEQLAGLVSPGESQGEQAALAGLERAEQRVGPHHAGPGVGHEGVAPPALVERDAVLLQPAEPPLADESWWPARAR